MCGIWALLSKKKLDIISNYTSFFEKLGKRGPDRSSICKLSNPIDLIIGFHRLAIMDKNSRGDQPFVSVDKNRTVYVICNGEIYNHKQLVAKHKYEDKIKSGSDCEVLLHLYNEYKNMDFCNELEGEYAFVIFDIDMETGDYNIFMANDYFGVRPMFVYEDEDYICISSEIKGIPLNQNKKYNIERFKPRHYGSIIKKDGNIGSMEYVQYYSLEKIPVNIFTLDDAKLKISSTFIRAVEMMIESDRPLGCLLSGGVDSSLVAAIASDIYKRKYGKKLRTFSIGLQGASDEYYAKLAAEYIGTEHTHVKCTTEQFLEVLPKIIETIETFDITTIRASTPQYLISKWIADNTDIRVLLVGDGSDEIFGYTYCHKAPNAIEHHNEALKLLNNIHTFDGLRADRCIAGNGVEARFPFLNHTFVEGCLSIEPQMRMHRDGVEKWLLRESFRKLNILPEKVLFRPKIALSDGCSSLKKSWFEIIREYVELKYTDDELTEKIKQFKRVPPHTKESLYYRETFCQFYGDRSSNVIPYYWMPNKDWCPDVIDPSARTLSFYKENLSE